MRYRALRAALRPGDTVDIVSSFLAENGVARGRKIDRTYAVSRRRRSPPRRLWVRRSAHHSSAGDPILQRGPPEEAEHREDQHERKERDDIAPRGAAGADPLEVRPDHAQSEHHHA